MSKALAFFPWLTIRESTTIGPVRLIPWERGRAPKGLPHASLSDIDSVLSAYANRPGHNIDCATLLEYGDWYSGTDADCHISDLFRARELIGFSALARRRLFRQSQDYCSFDAYSLVVQKYEEGYGGNFAFTTRRRDGMSNQIWSSDEFAFFRPHHVPHHLSIAVDKNLLVALTKKDKITERIFRAISEFNLANTDSNNVPLHVELVLMKSSFEWLFEINQRAAEFARVLKLMVPEYDLSDLQGETLANPWAKKGGDSRRLIEIWAREFCDWRGVAAHGMSYQTDRFVWPEFWHLAFASIVFPLLVKAKLWEHGLLAHDAYDSELVSRIEQFLTIDPTYDGKEQLGREHGWEQTYNQALIASHASKWY